jgi:hypothetical protein
MFAALCINIHDNNYLYLADLKSDLYNQVFCIHIQKTAKNKKPRTNVEFFT